MGCYILVIGLSSRPVVSGCRRCNLLLVVRDLKSEPQFKAAPLPPLQQVSAASAASGAVVAALLLAIGTRAAITAALLHCVQTCCPAGWSQHGMVQKNQKNQTMRKREMAHINQTRDILKIGYYFIDIAL